MHFISPGLHAFFSPRFVAVAIVLSPLALIVGALLLPVVAVAFARKRLRRAIRKHPCRK